MAAPGTGGRGTHPVRTPGELVADALQALAPVREGITNDEASELAERVLHALTAEDYNIVPVSPEREPGMPVRRPAGARLDDLILALQILRPYFRGINPTICSHDMLSVAVDPDRVSEREKELLDGLGFMPGEHGTFISYQFGSA